MNAYKVAFGLCRQERRAALLLVTLLPALLLGSLAKAAAITFQPPVTYPVGTGPKAAAVSDFNGDGYATSPPVSRVRRVRQLR